tara:strand:+ start:312 stop:1694 length:1383 start_codon:yes stop_codon:yes gene_type:complete
MNIEHKHNIKKRKIAVLGLGLTGISIINYFKNSENELICWDDDIIKRNQFINEYIKIHDLSDPNIWVNIDLLLISPGIPYLYPNPHPAVINALDNSVRIDNDIGLFFENLKNKNTTIICVTGSNGKSTTASLINHVLLNFKKNSEVGGNIGRPVLEFKNDDFENFKVLELSSYQIEIANFLSPDIAIFLNLSRDHLERHGGIGGYFNSKAKLFYNGMPKFSIINVDQPEGRFLANYLEKNANFDTKVIQISSKKIIKKSNWSISLIDGYLIERKDGVELFRSNIRRFINLPGDHNLINACMAYMTCKLIQKDPISILNNMKSFKGLPHRAAFVRKINEVTFINDSKATNMDSALKSISAYDRIRWIVGGQKKEGDKLNLQPYEKKIIKIYLIGSSAVELSELFKSMSYSICINLEKAVQEAYKESEPGDTILLAPGCASFDQFENFEKRGEKFCELVNYL